jgi:hypothetical protein
MNVCVDAFVLEAISGNPRYSCWEFYVFSFERSKYSLSDLGAGRDYFVGLLVRSLVD